MSSRWDSDSLDDAVDKELVYNEEYQRLIEVLPWLKTQPSKLAKKLYRVLEAKREMIRSEAKDAVLDHAAYIKDEYAYYGLSRSDFL